MTLVLVLFILSTVIELGLPRLNRKYSALISILAMTGAATLVLATILLLLQSVNVATIMIALVSAYRLISFARINLGRMHRTYLQTVSLRTTAILAGAQLELWFVLLLWRQFDPELSVLMTLVTLLQLAVAILMFSSLRRHIKHSRQPISTKPYSTGQLPSISIAVAARNETGELIECLESLLASDYPKLEIIVLDDCSQNRRTSEIIRSFAHRGVRFIPGGEPNSSWLARNHAYNTLANAVSGSYTMYCSTSTRLSPDSLRKMISYMKANDKHMLSVLPKFHKSPSEDGSLEAMRTAWELLPPRRHVGRPPVMSGCWMIRTSALKKLGGFAAVSRTIIPETYFSKYFATNGKYSFLPGGDYFGILSNKEYSEQSKTALRTYYPALHRRPENVLFFSLVVTASTIMPLLLLPSVLFGLEFMIVSAISSVTSLVLLKTYQNLFGLVYGAGSLKGAVSFVPAICVQIALLQYSMYKYEFSEVVWRDRNVCIPVMHVIPRLPQV